MRQTRFTEQMYQLGWLDTGFLNSPGGAGALQHCVARYYGWVVVTWDYIVSNSDIMLPKVFDFDAGMS